jgi:hypothetical protein
LGSSIHTTFNSFTQSCTDLVQVISNETYFGGTYEIIDIVLGVVVVPGSWGEGRRDGGHPDGCRQGLDGKVLNAKYLFEFGKKNRSLAQTPASGHKIKV